MFGTTTMSIIGESAGLWTVVRLQADALAVVTYPVPAPFLMPAYSLGITPLSFTGQQTFEDGRK